MDTAERTDGRRARGERTRAAIVDSLLELVQEGDLAPTAQRVADRAGVSVRSVYQHFVDVEGLFRETSSRARAIASTYAVTIDPALPIGERVDALVGERSAVLEALLPFGRASRLIEAGSEDLREMRHELDQADRKELQRVFAPELQALQGKTKTQALKTLDLVTSWSAWDHLRATGASVRSAREVMRTGVLAVLGSLNGSRP